MTDVVVDSSVVAKWILPEADSGQAQRVISDVASQGHRLIVLDLVFPEVANAIWKQYHPWTRPASSSTAFFSAQSMSNRRAVYWRAVSRLRRSMGEPCTMPFSSRSPRIWACRA